MTARYSDLELEAMLTDLESDLVERKESLAGDAPNRIREAVCAFANDLPDHRRPGVVFVGADDAGRPTGLHVTDRLLLQLADVKTDGNIVPPPTITVEKRILAGAPVAVVLVQPSDTPPVRLRGRTWNTIPNRRDSGGAPAKSRPRHRIAPSCGSRSTAPEATFIGPSIGRSAAAVGIR